MGRERDPGDGHRKREDIPAGGECGGGRNQCLQPELAEQTIKDAVVGVIVAAGASLEMSPSLVPRLTEAVVEQQIAGRKPEIPRDV